MSEQSEREVYIEGLRAGQTHRLEMIKLSADYGKTALRTAMIINGGAAIALLAFTGNVWSPYVVQALVEHLVAGFRFFSYGVLCAAVGILTAYFALYIEEGINPKADNIKVPRAIVLILRISTFALIVISLLLFYYGVTNTAMAFDV